MLALFAAPVLAQPVIDGSNSDADYGDPVVIQGIQTQFGDNFSEWDNGSCSIQDGRLYLHLAGNLEANFNKLEIFIDSVGGGENTLSGMPGNDNAGCMAGLTFDPGFAPDYHLIARRGDSKFDIDIAVLGTPDFSSYFDVFGGSDAGGPATTGTGPANASPLELAHDNSNVDGVTGGCDPADPVAAAAVSTGFEISIALSDLGNPAGDIQILAFQNNQDHCFASNQFLGSLPDGFCNLGFLGTTDLGAFDGDQFFTCAAPASDVPTVSEWGLLITALMTFALGTVHYSRQKRALAFQQ
jgi:hypothetical protein